MGYTTCGAETAGRVAAADAGGRGGSGPFKGSQQFDVAASQLRAGLPGWARPCRNSLIVRVGGSRMAINCAASSRLASFSAASSPSFQLPVGVVQPRLGGGNVGVDPALPVDVLRKHVVGAVAEQAEHGRGNRRVADGAVGIKHAVNVAPALGDHQFPDVPAHFRLHVLLERHVIRIGAGDAADFGVHELLAHAGGKRLGAGDVVGDGGAGREIVVERQHIHGIGERLHVPLVGHADRHRRLLVQLVERGGDEAGDLEALLLPIGRGAGGVVVRFIGGVPKGQGRFVADRAHKCRDQPADVVAVDRAVLIDEGRRVAEGDHQPDAVPAAGASEVNEVPAEGLCVRLPRGMIHEDAELIEFQAVGVRQVAFGFSGTVIEPVVRSCSWRLLRGSWRPEWWIDLWESASP